MNLGTDGPGPSQGHCLPLPALFLLIVFRLHRNRLMNVLLFLFFRPCPGRCLRQVRRPRPPQPPQERDIRARTCRRRPVALAPPRRVAVVLLPDHGRLLQVDEADGGGGAPVRGAVAAGPGGSPALDEANERAA